MRTFVISLKDSALRRQHIASELDRHGIPFAFLDALDGEQGRSEFQSVDERKFVINTGRALLQQEIGCFASHRSLWQRCVELNQPILIFEDDARLEENFLESLSFARHVLADAGYLRLQDAPPGRSRLIGRAGRMQLRLFHKPPQGAMCYAITPPVAHAFVQHSEILNAPVDKYLARIWLHGQPMFGLLPYSVKTAPIAYDSTIGYRQKIRKPLLLRIERTSFRLYCWMRRIAFLLTLSVFSDVVSRVRKNRIFTDANRHRETPERLTRMHSVPAKSLVPERSALKDAKDL